VARDGNDHNGNIIIQHNELTAFDHTVNHKIVCRFLAGRFLQDALSGQGFGHVPILLEKVANDFGIAHDLFCLSAGQYLGRGKHFPQ